MAKKKRKIKIGRVLILFFLIFIALYIPFKLIDFSFKSIIITGNQILSDKEIMDIAGISSYPSSLVYTKSKIKQSLIKNDLILDVKVSKKGIRNLLIEVKENKPIFYFDGKTILLDGTEIPKRYDCPNLINYVPNLVYEKFIQKMGLIDDDILNMVSEIKYDINEVDDERFLFYMEDGNYVYLTLSKFEKINNYQTIVKKFSNKKGIMYLDSGEYFKVVEE